MPSVNDIDHFRRFLDQHPQLFVLTGAGISSGSGIPVYRDDNGDWMRSSPVQYRDFIQQEVTRQRYWARSLVGWRWFEGARPNICHHTLAEWEDQGRFTQLVTQNVDRLHQNAGSRNVIDLHGRLDRVVCLDCGANVPRTAIQSQMLDDNPAFADLAGDMAPDGDANIEQADYRLFKLPTCDCCGGTLKPDVVFFGETLPKERLERALMALARADAVLVIGSSLMVYSGFRFCRLAHERGLPVIAINAGVTRADPLFAFKIEHRFEDVITTLRELPAGA